MEFKFKSAEALMLNDEIYVYKNFYPDHNDMVYSINCLDIDDWNIHDHGSFPPGRLSRDFVRPLFHDFLIDFISPEYWCFQHSNFIRLDAECGEIPSQKINLSNIKYILGYYIGDFEGGEIVFNDSIEYKPESNDLLIFNSKYKYSINNVISGTRYCYLDYVVENPGYTFV